MTIKIKEADWKILSQLRTQALERLCQQILAEIAAINADKSLDAHQRYLKIYQHVQRRDADIARAFNDHRRSTAFGELAAILSQGLLTPEEFQRFSQETRDAVGWAVRERAE